MPTPLKNRLQQATRELLRRMVSGATPLLLAVPACGLAVADPLLAADPGPRRIPATAIASRVPGCETPACESPIRGMAPSLVNPPAPIPSPSAGSPTRPADDPTIPPRTPPTPRPQPSAPPRPQPSAPTLSQLNQAQQQNDFLLASSPSSFAGGRRSATPNVLGDFFGQGYRTLTINNSVTHQFHTVGTIVSGSPGSPSAVLLFERDGMGGPDDFGTVPGSGMALSPGDSLVDTFQITEPLPPNEVPVSPGQGYTFAGGTVAFTQSPSGTAPIDGPFMDGDYWYASYSYTQAVQLTIPVGGLSVRRMRLAENNSPIPRDRIFFSHNFFNDVVAGVGDVNRYTVGFEKTFMQGAMSVDVRFPFAATLSSYQTTQGASLRNVEFGNISVYLKALLYENSQLLVSGGVGVATPTADDTRLVNGSGVPVLTIDNEAWHVLPFIAALWTPSDKWYLQGFLEVDAAANGSSVAGNLNGGPLAPLGKVNDATLLFADLSAGYWLHYNPGARLSGIIPVLELNYTTTTQDTDVVQGNGITLGMGDRRYDTLDVTAGTHFWFGRNLTISPAVVLPIRDGTDRQFDFETIVQVNYTR